MISTICPQCERELKLKDELAGRRIKCPSCGAAVSVAKEEGKKRTAVDEDAGDEEDRPRKKKKQKKSNALVWVAAAVGGLLLVGCLVGVVVLILNNLPEKKVEQAKASTETRKDQKLTTKEDPSLVQKIMRWKAKAEVYNDFKQIALFHAEAQTASTSGKVNVEQLKKTIERQAPGIYKEIKEGMYILLPGKGFGDNDVVAYENVSEELCLGDRVVAYRSTRVDELKTADLEKALGKKIK
jgi:DNA-directed RNA polymerase subunit RPC12/RpoP